MGVTKTFGNILNDKWAMRSSGISCYFSYMKVTQYQLCDRSGRIKHSSFALMTLQLAQGHGRCAATATVVINHCQCSAGKPHTCTGRVGGGWVVRAELLQREVPGKCWSPHFLLLHQHLASVLQCGSGTAAQQFISNNCFPQTNIKGPF